VVNLSAAARRAKAAASACHRSQLGGTPATRSLMGIVARVLQGREPFMRAQPPVANGRLREQDLFAGVS
jgi:hypothetical protein